MAYPESGAVDESRDVLGHDGDYTPDASQNVTTIFCPEVRSFKSSPASPPSRDTASITTQQIPEELLFLLPQNAFGTSPLNADSSLVLQLRCQVKDVQFKHLTLSGLTESGLSP